MEIGIYNTYTILYCTLPAVTQALLSAHTGLTTGPVELTTGPLWIELWDCDWESDCDCDWEYMKRYMDVRLLPDPKS